MKIAVIKTGGKQYVVKEGQLLSIEKIAGEKGETVNFDQVFLMADEDGKTVEVGIPVVADQNVSAEVVMQSRTRKIRVVKYKAKTRYHKVHGHRQHYTKVKITKIGGPAAPKAEKKEAPVVEKKVVAKKTEKK